MSDAINIEVSPFYHDYVLDKPYKVVIQVGGRFSSKSYNSAVEQVANLANKKNYKLLIIEDLDAGLSQGYYAGLVDKIDKFGHDKAYSCTRSPVRIYNKINKNEVLFSGFASEQQKKSVKAIDQVTAILVEEGEWLTYDDFIKLLHQLRGGRQEDRKLTIIMNPVNPDCFVNETFIETKPDRVIAHFEGTNRPKVFEKDIVTEFEFEGKTITDVTTVLVALSTHHDNPYLTIDQRASIENLRVTDPDAYLQLGEARFIRSKGTYFKEFKRETHVAEPFPIPNNWHRYITLDYGLDMLACYWVALDTQNNAFIYKELYESDLIISEAANKIKSMIADDETIRIIYAPPDLWNRRQDTGKSATDIFRENGLNLVKAKNDRVLGWYNLKEWIKTYETRDEHTGVKIITSKLKVWSNCDNLIRVLPQIQKDEKNPNDCAKEPHELTHAPDAIRYMFADRPAATYKPKQAVDDDDDDDIPNKRGNTFYG